MTASFRFRLAKTDGGARLGEITTAARGDPHAGLHAGRHGRDRQSRLCRAAEGGRRRHHPRQHLPPDAAAGRRARSPGWAGCINFMRWDRPILTDSGGFQVMSLAKLRKITDEGVAFQSHIDGARHMLTPERAVEIQCLLGSDIQMQLDECVALPASRRGDRGRRRRSLAWAERCQHAPSRKSATTGRQVPARRCSASCRAASMPSLRAALGRRAGGDGPARLRDRRAGGGRTAGSDARRRWS